MGQWRAFARSAEPIVRRLAQSRYTSPRLVMRRRELAPFLTKKPSVVMNLDPSPHADAKPLFDIHTRGARETLEIGAQ